VQASKREPESIPTHLSGRKIRDYKTENKNDLKLKLPNSAFSDGKSWKDHKEQEKKEQTSKKRTKKNPAT
jgi:hypothetical protein